MSFKIRSARLGDIQVIYDVQCAGFSEDLWESVAMFREIFKVYPQGYFLAEIDDQVVAYCIVQPADEDREDFDTGVWPVRGDETCLYLHDMCLTPAARGQGIARALLQTAEAYGVEHEFESMAGVSVQDTQEFWKKLGFTMVREYKYLDHIGMFMQKDLQKNKLT